MSFTYRQIQAQIKAIRNNGVTTPKLNSKKVVLEAWLDEYNSRTYTMEEILAMPESELDDGAHDPGVYYVDKEEQQQIEKSTANVIYVDFSPKTQEITSDWYASLEKLEASMAKWQAVLDKYPTL